MSPASLCKRLAADRSGATAVVLALLLLPLFMGIGAAIDFSRAASARVDLQSAVDAAALAVGRIALELGRTDNKVQARQAFDAGFQRSDGTTVTRFDVTQDTQKIVIDVDARIPMAFTSLLRMDSVTVNSRAEIPLEATTVEVALVLDNTGSMNSSGKLVELKKAANLLIDSQQNASVVSTYALVAVVPFATQVNVNVNSSPLPITQPSWVRIRAGETEAKLQVTAADWQGCIADRDKNYHAHGDVPNGIDGTLYPAAKCDQSGLAPIMPLTRDFATIRRAIDNMVATGNTNTTIGFAWGLNVLNRDAPLGSGAQLPGKFVKKHMLFLTDGVNTANRFPGDGVAQIDQGSEDICADIRTNPIYPGITVHTIRLIDGSETVLKKCATNPDKNYHFAETADKLTGVFRDIANQIISVRLAR